MKEILLIILILNLSSAQASLMGAAFKKLAKAGQRNTDEILIWHRISKQGPGAVGRIVETSLDKPAYWVTKNGPALRKRILKNFKDKQFQATLRKLGLSKSEIDLLEGMVLIDPVLRSRYFAHGFLKVLNNAGHYTKGDIKALFEEIKMGGMPDGEKHNMIYRLFIHLQEVFVPYTFKDSKKIIGFKNKYSIGREEYKEVSNLLQSGEYRKKMQDFLFHLLDDHHSEIIRSLLQEVSSSEFKKSWDSNTDLVLGAGFVSTWWAGIISFIYYLTHTDSGQKE